jgi:phosphoglycolate phosphatase
MLAGLKMAGYFSFVYGGNSFAQKKPDPVGVVKLMNDLNCSREHTMIVGDSDTDVLTARNAGVKVCGVSYGLGSRTLTGTPPDAVLRDLRDLVPLLNGSPSANLRL